MKLALHQSWDEVRTLSGSWNSLLAASASDTVFLTWEWMEAWWKNYGGGRPLFVVSAREQDELIGIAPFYIDVVSRWGRNWTSLRLIGDGSHDSDYLDCFARQGRECEFIVELVDFLALHQQDWEWLQWKGTPEGSPCLGAVLKCIKEKSWRFSTEQIPCATLPLPRRWDDYLRLLKPRMRTKVRSGLAFLDGQICSAPRQCRTTDEIQQWLPVLFELHTRRWETKSRPGVFRDAAKRNFYEDVSRALLARGWLAFHRLAWGERPLGLQYGMLYRNRFHLLQEGYDPGFDTLRPGLILRAWLMRHYIETGVEEYDFLAGVAPYKMDWGAQQKLSLGVSLALSRRSAWVWLDLPRAQETFKEQVRQVAPRSLLSWRQKLIAGQERSRWSPTSAHSTTDPTNGLVSRTAAQLYLSTPVGALGRWLAAHYEVNSGSQSRWHGSVRRRSTPLCQILIYHRVNDDQDPFLPALPVAVFRAQMEYLARHFPIVKLDDIAKGTLPENGQNFCVAITFDDGYRDNFLNAFPTLNELGLPATIFLTTGCIESGELPWYDQACLAFKLTTQARISLREIGGPEANLGSQSGRLQALAQTIAWLRAMNESERVRATRELFQALRVPDRLTLPNTMLNWEEIRRMSKSKVQFGAHTVTHPALAHLPHERLQEEILCSKQSIENRLQLPVRHFAYPFGQRRDFSDQSKIMVQRSGFETAVTTMWGFNRAGDDVFELKRFNPWEFDLGQFAFKLDWYRFRGITASPHDEKTVNASAG